MLHYHYLAQTVILVLAPASHTKKMSNRKDAVLIQSMSSPVGGFYECGRTLQTHVYIYPDMIIYINYINNVHDTKPSLVLA